jgi:hypothetical protein
MERYNVQERTIHFLEGRAITRLTRQAVERVIIIECGTAVTDDKTMDSISRNNMMLFMYQAHVKSFADQHFQPACLKSEMLTRNYNAKTNLNGKQLR